MRQLRLDESKASRSSATLVWKPVRRTLGVTAFGINAYVAAKAGDEVVEEHTETALGHEEIYVVVAGHATSRSTAKTVDAPAGTLVYLDDPKQKRHAVAKEPGTTVLAIGGVPGKHEISPWEYFFPALPAIEARDYDTARQHPRGGARASSTHRRSTTGSRASRRSRATRTAPAWSSRSARRVTRTRSPSWSCCPDSENGG